MKKNILLPLLVGALSAFGFAPFVFPPALIASYGWLFYQLLKAEKPSSAFRVSYFWALGHYVAGLYWIGNSMLIDAAAWWWAYPLALIVLPALFSLYQAVAGWLSVKLSSCFKLDRTPLMIGLFTLAEFFRMHWFTGFPWNTAGQTWIGLPWIAQNADYMGMVGLGSVTLLCAAALANYKQRTGLIAVSVMLVIMSVYGFAVQKPTAYDQTTAVRIAQPNIAQKIKWDSEYIYPNSMAPVLQSDTPPENADKAIIVWPETAQAKTVWEHPDFNRLMRGALRDWPKDTVLYSGLLQTETGNMANSAIASDTKGKIEWTADKHHLVPYGEYMPYDEILKLGPIVGMEGFNKGPPPRTMNDGVIPLICYEVIFPDLARHARTKQSRMIVTVTDDSWFGVSSGPHQHLAQVRFRAIENGLPVLRSANTGISSVIDPYGRILARTHMEEYATLDSALPLPLSQPPLYPKWGDLYMWLTLALAGLLTIIKIFC